MREVAPASELMAKTWVEFFHAYQIQQAEIERQNEALNASR